MTKLIAPKRTSCDSLDPESPSTKVTDKRVVNIGCEMGREDHDYCRQLPQYFRCAAYTPPAVVAPCSFEWSAVGG